MGEKNICNCSIGILMKQLGEFTKEYASVSGSICDKDKGICPFELKDKDYDVMTAEEKACLLSIYDRFCLTLQMDNYYDIDDKIKIDLIKEFLDENRSFFHREEERIMYTEAFRRLQYKTQVMINSASDDQRTRLLHSLEVQKISRKLSIGLQANYELAETIALAHDIGHAPFGHAGEHAINDYLEKNLAGAFSHALQSVKVVDFLCSHRKLKQYRIRGLGVSDYVLEGILKHDADSFSENVARPKYRLQYDCETLYKPVGIQNNLTTLGENRVCIGGIESQIVHWADKIAYMSHDWEEFVSVDLLEVMLSRINKMFIELDHYLINWDKPQYAFVTSTEETVLKEFNQHYEDFRNYFYSDEYKEDDIHDTEFVNLLKIVWEQLERILNLCNETPCLILLFSKEQYETLYSFFKIAWAWIVLTKRMPRKVSGKMDLIFVIYKYLGETTAHRTVPVLVNTLIKTSNVEIKKASSGKESLSREELILYCNNCWKSKQNTFNNTTKSMDKKQAFKDSLIIKYNGEYAIAAKYVNDFIYSQYIYSTRIKFMTQKARRIICRLMGFFHQHPEMLPIKQRKRIEFEINLKKKRNSIRDLLIEYYMDFLHTNNTEYGKNTVFSIFKKYASNCDKANYESLFELKPEEQRKLLKNIFQDYREIINNVIRLRVIADYVSGMTDRLAEKKYNEIVSSTTSWTKEFSEKGTFNV